MKVCQEGNGVVQLTPGDANHSPPGGLQSPISFAIGLERRAGPVRLTAVELNDQPLCSPEAVGFDLDAIFAIYAQVKQDVELGLGQVGAGEQRREPILQLAAPPTTRTTAESAKTRLDGPRPAPARMSIEQFLQALDAKPVAVFGLADRSFESLN